MRIKVSNGAFYEVSESTMNYTIAVFPGNIMYSLHHLLELLYALKARSK